MADAEGVAVNGGAGAVIGACLGGPVGAILGGILGAILGGGDGDDKDGCHDEEERKEYEPPDGSVQRLR